MQGRSMIEQQVELKRPNVNDLVNQERDATIEDVKNTFEYLSALEKLYQNNQNNINAHQYATKLLNYVKKYRKLRRFGGHRLSFYQKERQVFHDEFKLTVCDKKAEKIVKKIARHFGFKVSVSFYGNLCSRAFILTHRIRLRHNPSVGEICHELAHIYNAQFKTEKHYHTKRLLRIMTRMINYCRKKNFWNDEN
jgi:hypothetical protein